MLRVALTITDIVETHGVTPKSITTIPRTMRRAAGLRLALVLLAWFAQLCLPVVHASMMTAPRAAVGWCGDPSHAPAIADELPAEIREALGSWTAPVPITSPTAPSSVRPAPRRRQLPSAARWCCGPPASSQRRRPRRCLVRASSRRGRHREGRRPSTETPTPALLPDSLLPKPSDTARPAWLSARGHVAPDDGCRSGRSSGERRLHSKARRLHHSRNPHDSTLTRGPVRARPLPCAFVQAQSPQPAQLPSVVVTGKQEPDQARKELTAEQAVTPGGVTLVDAEELRQRNVTSLADMLRYVPGLWAAGGSTGDSSFLSSRGSNLDATNYDGNGIKLLQDGLPVTAADGNNHNRDVDPLSARYVIVARGANALTYGASTLGGAIDFITPTARDGAPNELLLNGGSHGQRQGRLTWGTVAGAFDALVTAEGKRSDGYREHQRQERAGLYANAGWQFGDAARTRFYATAIDNDQQLPGALTRDQWRADPGQAEAAAVAGDYQYNVKTWRLANKTTWDIDASSSLTAGLSYEEQQLYHPIVYAPPFFSLLIDTEQRNLGAHAALPASRRARTTCWSASTTGAPRSRAATTATSPAARRRCRRRSTTRPTASSCS